MFFKKPQKNSQPVAAHRSISHRIMEKGRKTQQFLKIEWF